MKKRILLLLCLVEIIAVGCSNKKGQGTIDNAPQEKTYAIRWLNYDDSALEIDYVKEGEIPVYNGETPTRTSTRTYDYTFWRWYPDILPAHSDFEYKAYFHSIEKHYTVTWLDYDGSVLEIDEYVIPGEKPRYDGEEPVRPLDSTYEYAFSGWTPTISQYTEVYEDITYTATYTATEYELLTYELSNDRQSYTVKGFNEKYFPSDGIINIPATYKSLPVTAIGNSAFAYCNNLVGITLTDNINEICDSSFFGCSKLASINIPDSVTSIGKRAFYSCESLSSISIPDSVTSIGDYAFARSALYDVSLGKGITSINEGVFYSTILHSISFPDTILSIGDYAFKDCRNISGNIIFPLKLVSVGNYAFCNCIRIESIDFSNAYVDIGYSSFENCCSLQRANNTGNLQNLGPRSFYSCYQLMFIELPEGLTEIPDCAFYDCSKLFNGIKELPSTIKTIGHYAFYQCYISLTSFPSSLTYIGDYAFYLNEFVQLRFPSSITYIGDYAFSLGLELIDVVVPENDNLVVRKHAFSSVKDDSFYTIEGDNKYLKSVSNNNYYLCECNGDTNINSNTKHIGPNAFENNADIAAFIVPNSVVSIGDYAFYNCSNLKTIQFGTGLKIIRKYAFKGTSLKGADLLNTSLERIEDNAFEGVGNKLSTYYYVLPDTVKYIGDSAFKNTYAYITIPSNVEYIGSYAYNNTDFDSWSTYVLPKTISYIGSYAFTGHRSYVTFFIPSSVNGIKRNAFNDSYNTVYCQNKAKPSSWEDGWSGSATVYWDKSLVTNVTINKSELELCVGESFVLAATISPDNAYDKTYSWSTSDSSVVTVSDGLVTAKKIGTATITVLAKGRGNNRSAQCVITVVEK